MFERIDAQADVYVLKDILHDWDDERCLKILQTVRAAMPTGPGSCWSRAFRIATPSSRSPR